MTTETSPVSRYPHLFVDRGPEGGNMITRSLKEVVENCFAYKITSQGLRAMGDCQAIDLETFASNPPMITEPPHLRIRAVWDRTLVTSGKGNNILGGNGRLWLTEETLRVPSVTATSDMLAFYGAALVKSGDVVRFPKDAFPIFNMEVGDNYLERYVMTPDGEGLYLEFHEENPHFHMPLKRTAGEESGHYLLAKWADTEKKELQITGFKIPDGFAVYTKKGAIHCDATLTGYESLLCGYDSATKGDFSTVNLRTRSPDGLERMANIEFIKG